MTAPVSVKLLDPRAKLPAYGSPDAAGVRRSLSTPAWLWPFPRDM